MDSFPPQGRRGWAEEAEGYILELGQAVDNRKAVDNVLCMSLAILCRQEALGIIKAVKNMFHEHEL